MTRTFFFFINFIEIKIDFETKKNVRTKINVLNRFRDKKKCPDMPKKIFLSFSTRTNYLSEKNKCLNGRRPNENPKKKRFLYRLLCVGKTTVVFWKFTDFFCFWPKTIYYASVKWPLFSKKNTEASKRVVNLWNLPRSSKVLGKFPKKVVLLITLQIHHEILKFFELFCLNFISNIPKQFC